MSLPGLPIDAVLPELLAGLRVQPSAVLIAPPGAGKTTAVAPALLDEAWCSGTVILLSPRRVAARAAAERMAELRGEPVGTSAQHVRSRRKPRGCTSFHARSLRRGRLCMPPGAGSILSTVNPEDAR